MELYPYRSWPDRFCPGELKHRISQTSVCIRIMGEFPANLQAFYIVGSSPRVYIVTSCCLTQMILIQVFRVPTQRTLQSVSPGYKPAAHALDQIEPDFVPVLYLLATRQPYTRFLSSLCLCFRTYEDRYKLIENGGCQGMGEGRWQVV